MAETIHQRIRRLRLALKIKQKELAAAVGLSPQAANQWEKDIIPRSDHLAIIARTLETTREYLLSGNQSENLVAESSIIRIDKNLGRTVPLMALEDLAVPSVQSGLPPRVKPIAEISARFPCSAASQAFEMKDDSMEPSVLQRDVIIIDPEISIEPGAFVAARIRSLGITVFREFSFEGADHRMLSPKKAGHRAFRFTHAEWDADVEVLGIMSEIARQSRKGHTR